MSEDVAYFCNTTGVRIVAPGVSKIVDPVNGVDEYGAQPAAKVASAPAKNDKTEPDKGQAKKASE